jgi:hypothetical protein
MNRILKTAGLAVAVAVTLSLSACTDEESGSPSTEESTPFTIMLSGTNPVLVAPENADAGTGEELVGVVNAVGTCLGITLADTTAVTVVWPSGTLATHSKPGLEVPASTAYDLPQARFAVGSPVQLQGGHFTDTSWIGEIPPECPIPEAGVFVASNAIHPPPAA